MVVISGQEGKNPLVLTHWVFCGCMEVQIFPGAELELFLTVAVILFA